MTQEQLRSEIKYCMIESCLRRLLESGLLTQEEFEAANGYNARKYSSLFSPFS